MTECIKFPVSFAGHHFEFIAFLVDIIDDFDFVIGSKSMFELEADMKYSNLTFEFAKRSIKLIPTRSYTYELELNDTKLFFIKPYPIREEDKAIIDKEMRRGVLLGILKKGLRSYSSPVMLIPRKITQVPRIVRDFRVLNSRIVKICSYSVPLLKDILMALGMSGVEVMSLLDLKDAYHSLRLSLNSKKYCAITPYYGSATYIYQRLGMGLSFSPQVWQTFLNAILGEVIDRGDEDPELLPYRESNEKWFMIDLKQIII